jgi:hypothetical protein
MFRRWKQSRTLVPATSGAPAVTTLLASNGRQGSN